jgi:hypothetical protein
VQRQDVARTCCCWSARWSARPAAHVFRSGGVSRGASGRPGVGAAGCAGQPSHGARAGDRQRTGLFSSFLEQEASPLDLRTPLLADSCSTGPEPRQLPTERQGTSSFDVCPLTRPGRLRATASRGGVLFVQPAARAGKATRWAAEETTQGEVLAPLSSVVLYLLRARWAGIGGTGR